MLPRCWLWICSTCAFFWGSFESVKRDSLFLLPFSWQPSTMEWYSHPLLFCPRLLCFFLRFFFHLFFLTLFYSFFSFSFAYLLASSCLRSPSMIALTLSPWNPPRFRIFSSGLVRWKFKSRLWRDFCDSEIKHVDSDWSTESCLKHMKEVRCTFG